MLKELSETVEYWFESNNLNSAVVGFSGGIDSAVTAALLAHARIPVTIVLALIDGQPRSSEYPAQKFADLYPAMNVKRVFFNLDMLHTDAAKEAALPIMRNAFFYGICAELRSKGLRPVCVGTTNYDEAAYLGFWGKASDAAQDFYPISHLHKSQVYELAKLLNVPQEIIDAVPSGDLLYSGNLNDYKMIGATYDQIQALAEYVDRPELISIDAIVNFIKNNIDNPKLFCENIVRNSFKYDIPFGQKHISNRLEYFRQQQYIRILISAKVFIEKHA